MRCGASYPSSNPRVTQTFLAAPSARAHVQLSKSSKQYSLRPHVAAPHARTSKRARSGFRVVAGRSGGKRDDFRRRDSSRRDPDEGELKDAIAILQREWPKLVLPGIGFLFVASMLGPMFVGATFVAGAAAATMLAFALPVILMMGGGALLTGAWAMAAVGMAGMYLLPALLGTAALVGAAVLGARYVGSNLLPGRKRGRAASARGGAAGNTIDADYDDWTGAEGTRGPKGTDREIEKELERMRRDAVDDLRSFDEVLRAKERFRRGPPPR